MEDQSQKSTPPLKGERILPLLILHILSIAPNHGYALCNEIEEVLGYLVHANSNQVYPLLHRLEAEGFLVAEWDHPTKRSRRFYTLTPLGHTRLEALKSMMKPSLERLERSMARLRRLLSENAAISGKAQLM